MTGQFKERRRDVRVLFRTTLKLIFPEGRSVADCETSDISVSGVFVKGVGDVGVGETCKVELQIIGQTSNLVLKMTGEIVRIEDDGVALQFLEVDEDSFYHLQNIVYFAYKHADSQMDFLADLEDVGNETLRIDQDAKKGPQPLPDDYLDDIDDEDDFDLDSFESIDKHIKHRRDDDDY